MQFYEIAPSSRQYHGTSFLTYSSDEKLTPGQLVVVKIRSKTSMGIVIKSVAKPEFKTAPIESSIGTILPPQQIELFQWLLTYYPGPLGVIAGLFLPFNSAKDYISAQTKPYSNSEKHTPPPELTSEQKIAVKSIEANNTVLLHGDTGSGKTRVYVEIASATLQKKRSVLILVPEIALSPQIVKTFASNLSAPVHVTHSGLTTTQRRKVWQAIAEAKEPQVVIGPRSAIFTPLENVGLVVVDEFHEPAYKQDQAPYYQTLRIAGQVARLNNAKLVMGSATPPVSEYFIASQKNIPIVRMKQKALQQEDTHEDLKTYVVNLREEAERTKYPLLSTSLLGAVRKTLEKKEQVLLFLNKRGSARVILCQACGWHALCERCDLPLTFHADTHKLQCHTCGYHVPAPSVCPDCSSYDIVFKSPGTKAITEAIQRAFPDANVGRFDKDNLKAEKLEARHSEVTSGKIDILIGTQLLAKGHDLPRLALVGILLAENELQFPDYTSSERSYQLMYQLIGRVGRGHRAGEVVIQTYDPENAAVMAATNRHSWEDFYKTQIGERKLFGFPPFSYLMKIEVSRAKMATVERSCEQIIKFIKDSREPVEIIGPTPSFLEKRNNTWNWQIIVKSKQRTALTRLATTLPIKATVNLDPSNLL